MSKKRGIGMACFFYGTGYGNGFPDVATATVEIHDDGTATVRSGAVDCGQGSTTILAQIAAEELGVPYEWITVITADTDTTPDAGTTAATRQTYASGNAVQMACRQAREVLFEYTRTLLGVNTIAGLAAREGIIYVKGYPKKQISYPEAAARARLAGYRLVGQGTFVTHTTAVDRETGQGAPYWPYAFGTQIAEVEVDTETGEVRVLKLIAAHDVGRAVNRLGVEGQIEGGVAQGLGMALLEKVHLQQGRIVNNSFSTYLIPTALDIPEIQPLIVETHEPTGPYGAKGVGEPATIPTVPAIINAIYNAVGVRITELPVTPEKILAALREKEGEKK
ncbi:xanthine dehydrogenase family protein molybdopterin-binding subunit [Moorella sp. E306M]|jgi:CO/xanthine dehydrogenase Mo-binding subunit|uniref:xanthine dehydrogenase family protein molybdopterin-binding subunit n=1 Tax=Moorella sp. E306M TaxID=2572683 RepID=UPI0010FFC316|nr:molybdopterin cofactor-binding domain-containing protein [Moorella sp. E306M]GEA19505.1 nicotinate dehydrogenase medium molybdopterin subunit [Moorella sp. E306M]